MSQKPSFKKIQILLADNDVLLAQVLAQNLREMGFENVHHVRNGELALRYIQDNPIDLLITEWDMEPVDGIDLIERIRSLNSPKRAMPIIMLTGKGEADHVSSARDIGITEFVIKPFTANTLYRRIEQIADHPRGFVLSDEYSGPDRRRKTASAKVAGERRTNAPEEIASSAAQRGVKLPAVAQPSHAFKKNLGITGPLATVITPQVLAQAQLAIDSMAGESIQWIKKDLSDLQKAYEGLNKTTNEAFVEKAKKASLSIKARAGTFGFPLASEVGRLLYLFLCAEFTPGKKMHLAIMAKHIETMQVMIAQNVTGAQGVGSELVTELKRLISMQK